MIPTNGVSEYETERDDTGGMAVVAFAAAAISGALVGFIFGVLL